MFTIMNTRLKQFLAAENISQAQFADTIKVVRASVSHVLAGRNNPSYDFIKAIMENYPSLNIEWLMQGKGKMYKDQSARLEVADVIEARPENTIESGLLFNDFPEDIQETKDNFKSTNEINDLGNMAQSIAKQRNISKIIVLFDDGSFQEI